jgi:hypothetical protein
MPKLDVYINYREGGRSEKFGDIAATTRVSFVLGQAMPDALLSFERVCYAGDRALLPQATLVDAGVVHETELELQQEVAPCLEEFTRLFVKAQKSLRANCENECGQVATQRCASCGMLCNDCLQKVHSSMAPGVLKKHVLHPASTRSDIDCVSCTLRTATYFCKPCGQPVCGECVLRQHDGHERQPMDDACKVRGTV